MCPLKREQARRETQQWVMRRLPTADSIVEIGRKRRSWINVNFTTYWWPDDGTADGDNDIPTDRAVGLSVRGRGTIWRHVWRHHDAWRRRHTAMTRCVVLTSLSGQLLQCQRTVSCTPYCCIYDHSAILNTDHYRCKTHAYRVLWLTSQCLVWSHGMGQQNVKWEIGKMLFPSCFGARN